MISIVSKKINVVDVEAVLCIVNGGYEAKDHIKPSNP